MHLKFLPKNTKPATFCSWKSPGCCLFWDILGAVCLGTNQSIFFRGLKLAVRFFFSGSVIVSLAFFPLTCVTYLIQVISWNYLLPMVLQWEMDLQRRRQWIWMKTARLPSAFSPPPKSKQLKLSKKSTLQTWKVPFFLDIDAKIKTPHTHKNHF